MGQFSTIDEAVLIRQGKPVNCLGLTFYPIQMCHYEIFLACQKALAIRQSTLPVKYAVKDYLNAIFGLEIDAPKENREIAGSFFRMIILLGLSLRIDGLQGREFFEKNVLFRKTPNGELEIDKLRITQNGNVVEISTLDFSTKIRNLIAKQNGIELPDENENADLAKAQQEMGELKGSTIKLDQSIESLISSVAYNSKVSEREIDDWTVREFENRRKAIERDKKYTLYGQAEMSGMVSFKKGNPYPSWCYDSVDETAGTMSMTDLQKQNGDISIQQ